MDVAGFYSDAHNKLLEIFTVVVDVEKGNKPELELRNLLYEFEKFFNTPRDLQTHYFLDENFLR